jgi:hypothetical protein
MTIKAIITGATGMVGEGVLLECLDNPAVGEVLVVTRKPLGRTHPKLREIIHADFFASQPSRRSLGATTLASFASGSRRSAWTPRNTSA